MRGPIQPRRTLIAPMSRDMPADISRRRSAGRAPANSAVRLGAGNMTFADTGAVVTAGAGLGAELVDLDVLSLAGASGPAEAASEVVVAPPSSTVSELMYLFRMA